MRDVVYKANSSSKFTHSYSYKISKRIDMRGQLSIKHRNREDAVLPVAKVHDNVRWKSR